MLFQMSAGMRLASEEVVSARKLVETILSITAVFEARLRVCQRRLWSRSEERDCLGMSALGQTSFGRRRLVQLDAEISLIDSQISTVTGQLDEWRVHLMNSFARLKSCELVLSLDE
jgi:hypothetical protein